MLLVQTILKVDNSCSTYIVKQFEALVVDGSWSKRAHKHSYNAFSGTGVIFGAAVYWDQK